MMSDPIWKDCPTCTACSEIYHTLELILTQPGAYSCIYCGQVWTEAGLEAATGMKMENKKDLEVLVARHGGSIPAYVNFGHRHLEKEKSAGERIGGMHEFVIPIEMMEVTKIPGNLMEGIESIRLVYGKKGV